MTQYNILDWTYSLLLFIILFIAHITLATFSIIPIIIAPKRASLFFRKLGSKFFIKLLKLMGVEIAFIGLENMPQERCILASNHYFPDALIMNSIKPDLTFICGRYGLPCFYFWDCIFVTKIFKNKHIFAEAAEAFKSRSICIYPEGDLIPAGIRVRYRRGIAVLAKQLKCKVVPVTHNFQNIFSGPWFIPYLYSILKFKDRKKLWIKIHKPVTYDDLVKKGAMKINESAFSCYLKPQNFHKNNKSKETKEQAEARIFTDRLQSIIEDHKQDL